MRRPSVKDWVKTGVFETDAAKISRVTIEIPGEEPLKVERERPRMPRTQARASPACPTARS